MNPTSRRPFAGVRVAIGAGFIFIDSERAQCVVLVRPTAVDAGRAFRRSLSSTAELVAAISINEAPVSRRRGHSGPPAWTRVGARPLSDLQRWAMVSFRTTAEIGDGRARSAVVRIDFRKGLVAVEAPSPRYMHWERNPPTLTAADKALRVYRQSLSSVAQIIVSRAIQADLALADLQRRIRDGKAHPGGLVGTSQLTSLEAA